MMNMLTFDNDIIICIYFVCVLWMWWKNMLGNGFGWLLMCICVHLVLRLPQFSESCDGKPWFHSQPHGFHHNFMRVPRILHMTKWKRSTLHQTRESNVWWKTMNDTMKQETVWIAECEKNGRESEWLCALSSQCIYLSYVCFGISGRHVNIV